MKTMKTTHFLFSITINLTCCFSILILILSSVASQAYRHFNVKTGASITIPCDYNREYIHHKKYWCSGREFNVCKIKEYANKTKGRVTLTDNPAESLFTVIMNNRKTGDTGWYWCVVEIGGIKEPDVKEDIYITVKRDPDLSVKESRVSGEEGGSVTVQCLYSAEYQNAQKRWCRFKDKNCNTDSFQNPEVQFSDHERGSFSVKMSRLKKSDAGWYWCSAGDLQVPVYISVSDPPPDVETTEIASTHHVPDYISVSTDTSAVPTTATYSDEETITPVKFCIAHN